MGHDIGDTVEELFDGIYRIALPTPYPVGPVNVYLFRDDDAFDLIDTGSPTEESLFVLESALAGLGLGSSRLRNIFLTHGHLDHAGALTALMEKFGAAAFSGRADIPIDRSGRTGDVSIKKGSRAWRCTEGSAFPIRPWSFCLPISPR